MKHDGFHIMARRDAAGVRRFTRNGHDFTKRFLLVVVRLLDQLTHYCAPA
jgi:ATP-dependent DNA ligase